MRRRNGYRRMRGAALALAATLLTCSVAAADSAGGEFSQRILTAKSLAETDLSANVSTVQLLVQMCLDELDKSDPAVGTLQSVLTLLDQGEANGTSISTLLGTLLVEPAAEESAAPETAAPDTPAPETAAPESTADETTTPEMAAPETTAPETTAPEAALETEAQTERGSKTGLPVFEVGLFVKTILEKHVLLDVPGDWGNNESGRALTSYSPVNDSGAISPAAGTLSISYFPMDQADAAAAFDLYEKNIKDMSVTTAMDSRDASAAELPARSIDFTMRVGANEFTCETICFAYEQMVYAIELMPGPLSSYDYFPVYQEVVDSAQVGREAEIAEAKAEADAQTEPPTEAPQPETQPVTEAPQPVSETPQPSSEEPQPSSETPQPEPQPSSEAPQPEPQPSSEAPQPASETPQPEPQPSSEVPKPEPQPQPSAGGTQSGADIGSFTYQMNGHTYQFPTAVASMTEADLPLDRQQTLPYDFRSSADMGGQPWTEIVNTQYYYLDNSLFMEMAAVTNMAGTPVPLASGIVTALIDTQGNSLNITLPGGIHVGSAESDIMNGFPEFAQTSLDGVAGFRGNELLYARNVRDDGCNGYVLIRNDAPYYSAVSIICDGGVVKEISFECLGSARATGVFLP